MRLHILLSTCLSVRSSGERGYSAQGGDHSDSEYRRSKTTSVTAATAQQRHHQVTSHCACELEVVGVISCRRIVFVRDLASKAAVRPSLVTMDALVRYCCRACAAFCFDEACCFTVQIPYACVYCKTCSCSRSLLCSPPLFPQNCNPIAGTSSEPLERRISNAAFRSSPHAQCARPSCSLHPIAR